LIASADHIKKCTFVMFPLYPLAVSRATIASMYPIQLVILAVLALLLGTLLLWLAGLS